MRQRVFQFPNLSRVHKLPVCQAGSRHSRRKASTVEESNETDKSGIEGTEQKFPRKPFYSQRVAECVPLAVKRWHFRQGDSRDREEIDPRDPKNKIITLDSGERKILVRGRLRPLYRDWEREFGKTIGDSRPYYRKKMGPMVMPYTKQEDLETLSSMIVVEGLEDWKTVSQAVFVCDGASILSHVYERYVTKSLGKYNGDVILLFDPDTAGRRMRTAVNKLMAPCKHGFISEYDAVVGMGTTQESIGIEHAAAESIRKALKNTRLFNSADAPTIFFEDLYELGLVQTPAERTEGVRLRRRFTCGFLGIGFCDGKQLLKQLNGYAFRMDEIKQAVKQADILLEEWKKNPWRLQKDYSRRLTFQTDNYRIPYNFTSAF